MAMVFPILLFITSAVRTVEGGSCRRDDQSLLQFASGHAAKNIKTVDDCSTPVPWPCDDDELSSLPIQLINREGSGNFERLNLTDGTYTPVCTIPGVTLNACGINPVDSLAYCITRGNSDIPTDQFVRINCNLSAFAVADDGVVGSLCWFGNVTQGSFAATFDMDGNYIFKTSGGRIRELTGAEIAGFTAFDTQEEAAGSTQVETADAEVLKNSKLSGLADFGVLKIDLGSDFFGGIGEQTYLIGCDEGKVFVQSLTTTTAFIELTMTGTVPPTGPSGAQWLYGADTSNPLVFCAYNNDPNYGVVQVNITQANADPAEFQLAL